MRNLVVGVASAAVLSSIAFGAQAADLIISPSYEQPVAQSSASSDVFTGVYIGGTAGVVTSDNFSDNNSAATRGAPRSATSSRSVLSSSVRKLRPSTSTT